MGLIYSALTYFIAIWNPEEHFHGSTFRVKIDKEQLILQDDESFQSNEQTLGDFSILPNEMIVHVLYYAEVSDVLKLSSTCKLMYKLISSSDALWDAILSKLDLTSHQIQLIRSSAESSQISMKISSLRYYNDLRILRPVFKQHKHVLKSCVLGANEVGKTQLVNRLSGLPFDPAHNATVESIESSTKFKCHDNTIAKILFFDTSPSLDGPDLMTRIRLSHIIFLVFDITRKDTFLRCEHYLKIMEWSLSHFHMILVGTHKDEEEKREVSFEVAKYMADDRAAMYFEISAKTGENIPEMLEHFVFRARKFADFLRTPTVLPRG